MDDNDFSREISKSVTSQLNLLVSNDSFDGVIFFAGKVQIFWGICFALVYIKYYGLDEPIGEAYYIGKYLLKIGLMRSTTSSAIATDIPVPEGK